MRPTLRQIDCFQAIVETGNFTRAAERMRTSQANLSHTIRDLEAVLNARLFDRTTRRVELTEAGKVFAEGALIGLMEIDRAAESVRDINELKRGNVRVAAPPFLAATIFPKMLQEAATLHPKLAITVEDLPTDLIVERLLQGRSDIGIGTFPTGELAFESVSGIQDRLMVFCAPNHILASSDAIRWDALAGHEIITLTRESNIRLLAEIGFEQAGLSLRPKYEVHQIQTALSLAEHGAGLAILPTYAIADLRGRKIVSRPLVEPSIAREVRLIISRDRAPSAATLAVRSLLRKTLRATVPEWTE